MKQITNRLWALVLMGAMGSMLLMPTADARLIFTTEDDAGIASDAYYIDQDGSSVDYVTLAFGADLSNTLQWDIANSTFVLNQDIDFGGNEITNFRIDNSATAPVTCGSTTTGQMYYDTDTNDLWYCNGTAWTDLASGTIADDSITAAKLNADTAGAGLVQNVSGALDVASGNGGIVVTADAITLTADGTTGATVAPVTIGANGVGVTVDNSTLAHTTGTLGIKAAGVTETQLNASVAGSGLTGGAGTALAVGAGNGITVNTNDITVKAYTPVSTTVAPVSVTGDGVGVTVDNSTLAHTTGTLAIKAGGVTFTQQSEREVSVTLTPEFPNFTLTADGTFNVGTMYADYDAVTFRNYYKWSTKKTTEAHDYDIVLQWAVPENFQGFSLTDNEIEIDYKTDTTDAADNKLDITLLDTAGATVTLAGGTDLVSSTADTWVDDSAITFAGGTFTPGEYVTLRVKMTSKATSAADLNPVYLGQVKFNIRVK